MIGDKYKIEVSYPGKGFTESFPINSSLEWAYEREDGQLFFRKKLSTKLTFKDDPAIPSSDFTELYTVERSANSRCDKIDVIVYKRCSKNGSWEEHYHGYLSMIDGEWNKSHCVVDIPIRPLDQYACLFENWEKDINILNLGLETFDSRSTIGTFEFKDCSRNTFTGRYDSPFIGVSECLGVPLQGGPLSPPTKGWTLVRHKINIGGSVFTQWAREVFIGPRPGLDWEDDGGKWVRTVVPVEDNDQYVDNGFEYNQQWNIVQYNLTNGVKLSDVIPAMVRTMLLCQYTVVSNLFNINRDGTAPANKAYTNAREHLWNAVIYDKTDVKRANDKDASGNATGIKNQISIKKLLDNLKVFNVYFIIDENEPNKIRLEHISYWDDRRMLDLTQARFLKDIEGRWKYTYEKESLPIKEKFEFMEPQRRVFNGVPIEYDSPCSNDGKNNETTYRSDLFATDVDDIVYHRDNYSDNGFVLVDRAPQGYIVSAVGFGDYARNGNFSWAVIQDNYHRWGRPQKTGRMNQVPTSFFTYKRTRKQEPIQIQLCCSDYTNFNPKDLVKTQLGWGEIQSAKYSEPSEVLTVELLHD